MAEEMRYDGKVAIVTGAGAGLGKAHALLLAGRGAKVVINDLGGDIHGGGGSTRAADVVVNEIKAAGGEAVANYDSVEHGDRIVKTAIDAWGRVDIVINNAGILRDVSFAKMTDDDWNKIMLVHLNGTYSVSKAAWPYMRDQNYGRIVNTTSAAGIYGNFGQANYSAAKLAILGFGNTLAIEGANRNIHVNTIAPIAGSRLTETVLPKPMVEALKPEFVSPLVAYLVHENTKETGALFEVGAGWIGKLRWERTKGYAFDPHKPLTPDMVASKWKEITDWTGANHPATIQESTASFMTNLNRKPSKGGNENIDLDKVLGFEFKPQTVEVAPKDCILYALGVGAAKKPTDPTELRFTYENAGGGFKALPTMGVTFPFSTLGQLGSVQGLKFNPMMLLHGEQYLELKAPIPTRGKLTSSARIANVYDKGKGALMLIDAVTKDEKGNEIAYNQFSLFIRGIGDFGGDRGPTGDSNTPPDRAPDAIVEEKTSDEQALLYRLSGDWNPLHADPNMAKMGGFDKPILHGLCTFGYVGRAVLKTYCENDPARFRSIKVRFAKHVFPGETIVTEMWKEGDKIILQARAKERGEVVLSNAAVQLQDPSAQKAAAPAAAPASAEAPAANGGNPEIRAIFDRIKANVEANPGLVETVGAVFQFDITGGENRSWSVDLKTAPGSVKNATAAKADCTITIADEDFLAMNKGALDPQQAFMQGRLQIGGNMMLAQKLGELLRN
jgi:3-hydroxyacyl-CoA dehydrogenase/3a,7a,12a-trihydroxy-5b-cholest-24-enoyl-CoA hydratase